MATDSLFMERLKQLVPLSSVIGRSHRLVPVGSGRYKLCCPFHRERTPSCHVDDNKGVYHCFGCGKSGDVVTFVMQTQGHSFGEAIRHLADGVGLAVPTLSSEQKAEQYSQLREREKRRQVMQAAADWFVEQLQKGPQKDAVWEYLSQRGMVPALVSEFGLGWAPASLQGSAVSLVSHLAQRFSLKRLHECGLIGGGKGSGGYDTRALPSSASARDFFRQRLMFPVHDHRGQLVAFGGRYLPLDRFNSGSGLSSNRSAPPKYLNTRATSDFLKRATVYNLHRARQHVSSKHGWVLVEGYTDVLSLHQIGITTAVAPLGTAVTMDHWQALWRVHRHATIMFDGDTAGRKAAYRAIAVTLPALTADHRLMVSVLPAGKDPDSLCRQTGGQTVVRQLLVRGIPFSQFVWQEESARLLGDRGHPSAEHMALLEHSLEQFYKPVRDSLLKRHLWQDVRDRLWQVRRGRQRADDGRPTLPTSALGSGDGVPAPVNPHYRWQVLLAGLLACPGLALEFAESLVKIPWPEPYGRIVQSILEYTSQDPAPWVSDDNAHAMNPAHSAHEAQEWSLDKASSDSDSDSDSAHGFAVAALTEQRLWQHLVRDAHWSPEVLNGLFPLHVCQVVMPPPPAHSHQDDTGMDRIEHQKQRLRKTIDEILLTDHSDRLVAAMRQQRGQISFDSANALHRELKRTEKRYRAGLEEPS